MKYLKVVLVVISFAFLPGALSAQTTTKKVQVKETKEVVKKNGAEVKTEQTTETTTEVKTEPVAEEPSMVEQKTNEAIAAYRNLGEQAHLSREKSSATLLFNYSSFDLLLPSKMGATVALHSDADTLYELEYLRSSVSPPSVLSDLASATEQRISINKRNFSSGGTFNWYWGFAYNSSNIHVSEQLMTSLNQPGTSDMVDVQTLGMNIGIGNRWVIKEKFSIGVDWFSWSQPLLILKKEAAYLDKSSNESDRDKVDTILKVVGYFPRWAAFKVSLGYSF